MISDNLASNRETIAYRVVLLQDGICQSGPVNSSVGFGLPDNVSPSRL